MCPVPRFSCGLLLPSQRQRSNTPQISIEVDDRSQERIPTPPPRYETGDVNYLPFGGAPGTIRVFFFSFLVKSTPKFPLRLHKSPVKDVRKPNNLEFLFGASSPIRTLRSRIDAISPTTVCAVNLGKEGLS